MSRHSGVATIASAIVVAVTATFYLYAFMRQQDRGPVGYQLEAIFLSSNGLHVGADVRLAGVKVGTVSSISLDPVAFVTHVGFYIGDQYHLPADTSLTIGSSGFTTADGLLIEPGHSDHSLAPGETIRSTREMLSLEQSISQYIFGAGGLGGTNTP